MTARKHFQEPDHHGSALLPVSILLLSVLAISAYLAAGRSSGQHVATKVYLPAAQTQVR